MALVPGKRDTFEDRNVKGGYNLTQMEAIDVQKKLIDEWEPTGETYVTSFNVV